ncbi:MAG: TolC family protein [Acidobacteriia bacterium]|nr:TolC family protein [Terriglobia bacterium]
MCRWFEMRAMRRGLILWLAVFATPALAQTEAPYHLTLKDAIQRGLQANLSGLVSQTRIEEAEGTRQRRFANLLPHAHIETPLTYQNRNLKTQGISIPLAPEVVGPFGTYDFRFYADQTILDLQSYHNWKASEQQEQSTRSDYHDVRDQIVRAVAGLYLNAQANLALADAAASRVTVSDALYKLASDQHDQGTATGVDVLRAQVQLANDRQSLLANQNAAKIALLALERNIGMHPGTPLELAEPLDFQPLAPLDRESAIRTALEARSDYQSLARQRAALSEQLKASQARYLPRIGVSGNYGGTGRSLPDITGTGALQANLTLNVFDRDRQGEAQEIKSRIERIERQMSDLRLGIEQDVGQALLNLESAADQVGVAKSGLELAQRELELSRDRFQHGVTNNIEVISAQDSVERAQQNLITALTLHADAKVALARALGDTEKSYESFLGIH